MNETFLSRIEQGLCDFVADNPGCRGNDIDAAFPDISRIGISAMIDTLSRLNMIQWGNGEDKQSGWYVVGRF